MGLFSSKKDDKLDASKKITESRGEKILKYMDPKDKQKVKKSLKELGAKGKSYQELSEEIREKHGSKMKEKFEHAAKKYEGGGLTTKEKRRNISRRKQSSTDKSTGYKSSKITFAGGDVQTRHRVSLLGRDDDGSRSRFAKGNPSGGGGAGINTKRKGDSGMNNKSSGGFSSSSPGKKGGGRPLGF